MNDIQQQIIETLERGNLVGKTSGDSRIVGGTAVQVTTTSDATYSAVMLMPAHGFTIEKYPPAMPWVGLIEMNASALCVYASADPVRTAQGIVDYFAIAKASGLSLRAVREELHRLEMAHIQLLAASATQIQLYWETGFGDKSKWFMETDTEQLRATLQVDPTSQRWTLKGADGKKQAGGTLADVVKAALAASAGA